MSLTFRATLPSQWTTLSRPLFSSSEPAQSIYGNGAACAARNVKDSVYIAPQKTSAFIT